jgi:DNA mismatch repair protein MutS
MSERLLENGSLTPAMRQWRAFKDRHPDKIVLFRMGDFYEMFGEDARVASKALELVLTTRDRDKPDPVPMCGVPHHALNAYLAKLLKQGFKVAICDQTEDPSQAKGLVKRDVTRVVTPGTVLEEGIVEGREPVILASWRSRGNEAGLAWADLSSGDVRVSSGPVEEMSDRLRGLGCKEILHAGGDVPPLEGEQAVLTLVPDDLFDGRKASERLARLLGLPAALPGIPSSPELLGALCALLDYARQMGGAPMRMPALESKSSVLFMDEATRRNLEITSNAENGGREGTLLEALDETRTPMGARLLSEWAGQPSAIMEEILERQDQVAAWVDNPQALRRFREALKGYPDLSRIVARFNANIASPRDAGALREALARLPEAAAACREAGEIPGREAAKLPMFEATRALLEAALVEAPPPHAREGNIFAPGYNAELDRLRLLAGDAHGAILRIEAREREATGITSLKIRYNKVFGYFMEVSKANLARIPSHYERRQTLVNAERFVTPELRELESQILSAREKSEALEAELWSALCEQIRGELEAMRDAAALLARMDVLAGFAFRAQKRGYVKPIMVEEPILDIADGRHPVLESDERHQPFVPNPTHMDTNGRQITILTGPNMGGKSTYLRQSALICVMAQMGSFVPASKAVVGVTDRLFCRAGAGDSLRRGLSTFMVEMTETAAILRNATNRSLVFLDEVGRGTSTYDGMAIAWAVVEALLGPSGIGCRTLFATHYHELTELGRTRQGVANLTMAVRENAGKVVFLRSVEEGAADKSYGIHVAQLAGVPEKVVARAREVLLGLEARREPLGAANPPSQPKQPSLFDEAPAETDVLRLIRQSEPNAMTPIEALALLESLKRKLS